MASKEQCTSDEELVETHSDSESSTCSHSTSRSGFDENESHQNHKGYEEYADDEEGNRKLIDISRQFEGSLKYDKEEDYRLNEPEDEQEKKHFCVHFEQKVFGVEIRSFRDYSTAARELLWNSFAEIQKNAERNMIEFRADGWDWRNACEEMVLQDNGELVHPASFKRRNRPTANKKRSRGRKKPRLHRRKAKQYAS